jgi:hypothetical protein
MQGPVTRAPLRGVANIVRFNAPIYAVAVVVVVVGVLVFVALPAGSLVAGAGAAAAVTAAALTLGSLVASYLTYDRSGFYTWGWFDRFVLPSSSTTSSKTTTTIAHVHTGLDESTAVLRARHPHARVVVFDAAGRRQPFDNQRDISIRLRPLLGDGISHKSNLLVRFDGRFGHGRRSHHQMRAQSHHRQRSPHKSGGGRPHTMRNHPRRIKTVNRNRRPRVHRNKGISKSAPCTDPPLRSIKLHTPLTASGRCRPLNQAAAPGLRRLIFWFYSSVSRQV